MRTYENTKIYKVVNNIDDVTFFGYTSMSLPSRLASLKKESSNPSSSGAAYEHMRATGKEHFKLVLVETFPCRSKDEVTARIATLTREDVKADDGSTELEAKVERLERKIEEQCSKDNEKGMNSCETERLCRELEEQRKLIIELYDMVQQLSNKVLCLQPLPSLEADVNKDAEDKPVSIADSTSSELLNNGFPLEALQPPPDPLDNRIQPPSPPRESTGTRTPEHFDISDGEVEAERPQGIPHYDLTEDMFKVFKGKVDEEDVDILKDRYVKVVRLGRHIELHPRDEDNKCELMFFKESLAKKVAGLRVDANDLNLDKSCLKLLDTIEKDAGVGNNLRKKAAWHAADFRRRVPFEDEGADEA
jgi:hypothetical protein